jgi:dipeptidase D
MSTNPYAGLEPSELWRHFAALNNTPRPSRHEERAREYVLHAAREAGVPAYVDAAGNAVLHVSATPGFEGAPVVAVQAHLDMVCEKRPGVTHDFHTDPIRPRREGDRVYATGTTLGADNGVGAAAGLAVLTDASVAHGPLDLLFTVREEIGLEGARELDASLLRSKLLINLDSEDPRELTVGCAGGAGAELSLPIERQETPDGWAGARVVVSGLKGGHSGVQIHERLANAIKLLTQALRAARSAGVDFLPASVSGGNARNAIPRDAEARLALPEDALPVLRTAVGQAETALKARWLADEPGVAITVEPSERPERVLDPDSAERLLALLHALPHGVLTWSEDFPGKVETSSNLAQVSTGETEVRLHNSSRSFVEAEMDRVQDEIGATGKRFGANVVLQEGYPGWEPNPDSQLLRVTQQVYRDTFGEAPEVQVIHAGLECGVIVSKVPGMEAISFGPRIRGAHTPEEYVDAPTVEATWRLLTGLLRALAAG